MGETTAAATPATAVAKKTKATNQKSAKTARSHPRVAVMVNSAIVAMQERGGSSLQAIKKHIAVTHKLDAEKLSPFINKYVKRAVLSGSLVQTKGKGATGSFRLGATGAKPKTTKKIAAKTVKKPKPAAPKAQKAKKVGTKVTKKEKVWTKITKKARKPRTPKPKKAKSPVKKAAAKKGAKK